MSDRGREPRDWRHARATEREIAGLTSQLLADAPSGNPLNLLTLPERAIFVLRAYRFHWTEIASLLHRDRSGLYMTHARAMRKLERVVQGRSFGLPDELQWVGIYTASREADGDDD